MNITYIHHSGFLVDTREVYYIFDYDKGPLPGLDTSKPVFVFVSHGHTDHYNPEIFPLLISMGMKHIVAVLSNDIPKKRYPACLKPATWEDLDQICRQDLSPAYQNFSPACPNLTPAYQDFSPACQGFIPAVKAYHSQEYTLPFHTSLQTLLSTDKGVAFLLTCPEGTLYHGGDLNEWILEETPEQERRQMTGSYLASIHKLKSKNIDIAFLPLDPRLGKYYAKGFVTFLKTIPVKHVYPMHYWEQPEIITQFLQEYPEYADIIVTP